MNRGNLAAIALLGCVSVVTYAGTLGAGFVWDDEQVVVGGPENRDPSRILKVLGSPDEIRPYYRPLTRASYLLDHALWGLDPRGFHAVNVLLHLLNVLLLHALGRRLFADRAPALLAALLLAVHPLHVESVAFISARNNLFALLFSLAALLLFMEAERRTSAALAVLSGLAFFLGLASKEQAVMAGPLLLAWTLRPDGTVRTRGWRWVALLAPAVAAAAAYLALRTVALGSPGAIPAGTTTLATRLVQTFLIVPRYLGLAVFPAGLTIFHRNPQPDAVGAAIAAAAWLGAALAVAALLRKPSAAAALGLLWLGLFFLPVANLVPIPSAAMAERFVYLPAVGLWILVAEGVRRLAERFPGPRPWVAAWAVVLVALAARTVVRNRDWRDDLSLARSAVAVDPGSVPANYNLGVVLKDRGDLEGARQQWEQVLALEPSNPGAHTQLGTLAAVGGDLAAAERHFRAAVASGEPHPLAYFNLGVLCERTGRPAEALASYQAFLSLVDRPDSEYRVGLDPAYLARARQRIATLRASSFGEGRSP